MDRSPLNGIDGRSDRQVERRSCRAEHQRKEAPVVGPSETIDTAKAEVVPTADWKTLASDATRRTLQAARGILQAQSSAETTTSGLGDSLQRIHALSSTDTEVELAGASYFSQGAPSAAVSKGGQRRVPVADMDARRPPGQDGRGGYDRLQQQAIWMVEMHPQPERFRSYCNADDHRRQQQQQHQQHHHHQHQQQQHRLQPEVRDEFQDGGYSYYNSLESLEKYKDYFEEEFRESARHQQQVAMTQQHAENERGNSRQRCDGLESRKQRREKINDAYHEGPIYLFISFIYCIYFVYLFLYN